MLNAPPPLVRKNWKTANPRLPHFQKKSKIVSGIYRGIVYLWYFFISAQEEDDAGTAGVLNGGDYIGGIFRVWALGLEV